MVWSIYLLLYFVLIVLRVSPDGPGPASGAAARGGVAGVTNAGAAADKHATTAIATSPRPRRIADGGTKMARSEIGV